MKQRFLSLFPLALILSLCPFASWAQYSIKQNFEATGSTLGYTATIAPTGNPGIPGQTYTGNASNISGSNALPSNPTATSPFPNNFVSSSTGYGVYNPNGQGLQRPVIQLDFSPVNIISSAGTTISFRLAAYSDGNAGGITSTGRAILSLATNLNNNTFTDYITVTGPASKGAYWDFGATGIAQATYPNVTVIPAPASDNLASSAYLGTGTGISTVQLTLPAGITSAKLRITLEASAKSVLLIDDVVISGTTPLPVTLTSFTASRQSSNVYVKWATATEKNNAYFEVQRSNDGKAFTTVGKVTGNGTTATGASYNFTDRNPLAATSYYRLRQVDNDATETYSSVVTISGADKIEASFYPNPSNSLVTLPAVSGLVKYRVYTATGQNVATGEAQGGSEVSLQQVPAGIYFLELITAGKHNVQRFVKQ